MKMEDDWRIEKKGKALVCFTRLSCPSGWYVPILFAPPMETLLNVSKQALFLYSFTFAFAHVILLEILVI